MEKNKTRLEKNINFNENYTIIIGSANQIKIEAVRETLKFYPVFNKVTVDFLEVSSGVSDQPLSLEETIQGAMNRAKTAFQSNRIFNYSFGIESGLFSVPYTETGFMNICACAIYNGHQFFIGLSSAFECPSQAIKLMVDEKLDMNQAFKKLGITHNPKLGSAEGTIGILTNGRINRLEYTKQAIIMALIKLENSGLFEKFR